VKEEDRAHTGRGRRIECEYDIAGQGSWRAPSICTHIGGGKVNVAPHHAARGPSGHRVARTALTCSGSGRAAPSTLTTGYRYAQMGYTACFEPVVVPANARHAHMEMGDTPIVDKGGYAMLGNDDFLLRMLASGAGQKASND
jgi:formylmethanofuran dehydrogenase subunit A